MTTVKRIVCFANSRKLSARCVAGKELLVGRPGSWIRPVSTRPEGEVSLSERRYPDGSDPRVMDVIDVPLLTAKPRGYKLENWLLDATRRWTKVGRAEWKDLARLTDPITPLWFNNHHTFHGLNDEIPLELANTLSGSLRLIRVDHLTLRVLTTGEVFGKAKRRVQGRFLHYGTEYWLWVTDPAYERAYRPKPDGDYEIGESFLTISLGEPYNDACYKLIAAIIACDG